jgi:hypothetical protein
LISFSPFLHAEKQIEEHTQVQELVRKETARLPVVTRGHILHLADGGRSQAFIAGVLEVSAATVTGICRRLPDMGTVRQQLQVWTAARNAVQAVVDWRFTTWGRSGKIASRLSQNCGRNSQ